MGGVREQRNTRIVTDQALEGFVSLVRNVSELFAGGLDLERAIGEQEESVLAEFAAWNIHDEEGAYHGLARCRLDDLQGRGEDLDGSVAGTAYQTVAQTALHHEHGEMDRVLHQLFCLFRGHALSFAQFVEEICEFFLLIGSCRIDDRGAFKVVTFCSDLIGITQDDDVRDTLRECFLRCFEDALIVALGQNDGLLVRFGAVDQRVNERGHA